MIVLSGGQPAIISLITLINSSASTVMMTGRTILLPFFIIIPEPITCPSRQNPPEMSPSVTSTCPVVRNSTKLVILEERLTS